MYGKGISREGSLLDIGVDLGIVKKSGAWYTYDGEQLGQGRENAKKFLTDNAEIMVEISERIRTQVGIGDQRRRTRRSRAASRRRDPTSTPTSPSASTDEREAAVGTRFGALAWPACLRRVASSFAPSGAR